MGQIPQQQHTSFRFPPCQESGAACGLMHPSGSPGTSQEAKGPWNVWGRGWLCWPSTDGQGRARALEAFQLHPVAVFNFLFVLTSMGESGLCCALGLLNDPVSGLLGGQMRQRGWNESIHV